MKTRWLLYISSFFLLALGSMQAKALNQTYTVCGSGCDFTTLTEALSTPGLNQDTLELTNGYNYSDNLEDLDLFVPNAITLTCSSPSVTFGDEGTASMTNIYTGSDFKVEGCTFENVNFDSSGKENLEFLDNIFSADAYSRITLTFSSDFTIQGNQGLGRIQIQKADDGLITENAFECRYDNECVHVGVAGAMDYTDPGEVSNNITVSNNTITNFITNNGGDWMQIDGGFNTQIIGNTFRSAVTMDDVYLTMMTIRSGEVEVRNNYLIAPEKINGANSGTWLINMRIEQNFLDATIHHNTLYLQGSDNTAGASACIGLFDNGSYTNAPITIDATYNLCHQDNPNGGGSGFNLSYTPGSADITLTDSFNGIHNTDYLISDTNNIFTSLNANTITKDPLFRTENISSSDDFQLSPISNYLDVDGTEDIGAYSAVRQTQINIDGSCTVDYSSCHSTSTDILADALRSNDQVSIASGTYSAFEITGPYDSIQVTGTANTIINAMGGQWALKLTEISNSLFSTLTLTNSVNGAVSYTFSTGSTYSTISKDYNNPAVPLLLDNTCNGNPLTPGADISSLDGVGTNDFHLALVDIPTVVTGTILIPNSLASSKASLASTCGVPEIMIEVFVPSILDLNGSTYTYNAGAASGAGVFPTGGGNTLAISTNMSTSIALQLQDALSNTFEQFQITNSSNGVEFSGTSSGNTILSSEFSGISDQEVRVTAATTNALTQSIFDRSKLSFTDAGVLNVYNRLQATVIDALALTPIEGAQVQFRDGSGTLQETHIADAAGNTPWTLPLLVQRFTQASPSISVLGTSSAEGSKAGYISRTITKVPSQPNDTFTVPLIKLTSGSNETTTRPPSSGGGSFTPLYPTTTAGHGTANEENTTEEPPSHEEETSSENHLLPFTDFNSSDPDWEAFLYAYTIKALTGNPDNTIEADTLAQRDQLAKVITTVFEYYYEGINYCAGEAPFVDVPLESWSAQYICAGKKEGIITGYPEGDTTPFRPAHTINRAEFMALLTRALKLSPEVLSNPFPDVPQDIWYAPYAQLAKDQALYPNHTLFEGSTSVTRREVAQILYLLHLANLIK